MINWQVKRGDKGRGKKAEYKQGSGNSVVSFIFLLYLYTSFMLFPADISTIHYNIFFVMIMYTRRILHQRNSFN